MITIEKEKDIVCIVETAIHKLSIVRENAQKENKQIVSDLAKDLEGIIPMDTICTEIISRLQGHLQPRTIRKYLDERYKIRTRVDNARKQKTKQSSLAALGPLNNNGGTVVVSDKNEISFPDQGNRKSIQSSQISFIDNEYVQNESLDSREQKQPSNSPVNTGLTECPGCIDREDRIKELEEAFLNVPQFIAADKIGLSTAIKGFKEEPEEPLEFEVSKKEWEIRNYMNKVIYPGVIWFNGRIDKKSGRIINFDLGRLDQLRQKSVPNRDLD